MGRFSKKFGKSENVFGIFGNIPKESVNVFRLFPYVLSIAIPRKELDDTADVS